MTIEIALLISIVSVTSAVFFAIKSNKRADSKEIAERVARAIKLNIKKGTLKAKDFPLLLHIDEIISDKKEVNIPWEKFTFEK